MNRLNHILTALFILHMVVLASAQQHDSKLPDVQKSEQVDQALFRYADLPWVKDRSPNQQTHQVNRSQLRSSVLNAVKKRDPLRNIWIETPGTGGRAQPKSSGEMLKILDEILPSLNHEADLVLLRKSTDALGMTHHFLEQHFQDIPVFGAQLTLHETAQGFVRMNGRLFAVPQEVPENKLPVDVAVELVKADLTSRTVLMNDEGLAMQLLKQSNHEQDVLYFDEGGDLHRAWHVKFIPNIYENWEYIIDANSNVILRKWNNVCQMHNHASVPEFTPSASPPPELGSGVDLNGANLQVRCFNDNGTFFLLDASREMFQSLGSANVPPQGAIVTYDTKNQPIDRATGFYPNELITSSNANSWDPKAVSAHVNAGIAYEFFRQLLMRNSINGSGGTIYSFINVVDPETGREFDQAFWNDKIMFYGNGDRVFNKPLQAALDVSAHEMSHGVVQNTANLIYQGEAGAINESLADFFGVATEARVTGTLDWKLANGVINPSIFRSGALRDLSNPHNGGSSLNDAGYQPQFYNERFTGSEDFGGVHINSGIVNHAFYLVTDVVGLEKAEQIVYRSLTNYLTRSSNFQDLRNAMVAAATDLYGNAAEVQAINDAFDFVGIMEGTGVEEPMDAVVNPGDDFLLATSTVFAQTDLYQLQSNGQFQEIAAARISKFLINPPSVSDDGQVIIYVTDQNQIEFISVDDTGETLDSGLVSTQDIWRNAVISRDGNRIAALTTENDNMVWIFDLLSSKAKQFELSNPTFTEGVSTGNVQFADAMDFDFSGELLMYDASNLISATGDSQYSYWDIGFLEVYDNIADDFADGHIFKLVGGLPDNVNIANPVFSKNSPHILAFDYIETLATGGAEYAIIGANIETGDAEIIHEISEQGGTLGYPTFSRNDEAILFSAISNDQNGQAIRVVKAVLLSESKIGKDPNFEEFTVLENHRWPVWFANGERMLTTIFTPVVPELNFEFYPNPVVDRANIKVDVQTRSELRLRITDVLGRTVKLQKWPSQSGSLNLEITDFANMSRGVYLGEFWVGEDRVGFKIMKE